MKYMPKYSGNEFELRIGRTKIDEDKGEYTVKAENSYGKLEASAFLNIERELHPHHGYIAETLGIIQQRVPLHQNLSTKFASQTLF